MGTIDAGLQARLEAEVTTLCHCWRLRRSDGFVLGLTDHDRPIMALEQVFEPGASIESGTFSQTSDLRPGQAAAGGLLSHDALSEKDLSTGLWDGATVDVFIVDWQAPELGAISIWTGLLSDISHSDTGVFEASLVSLKAELERSVGRVIRGDCGAQFGDARCGVSDIAGRHCDKRFETCCNVFGNAENFRGFPHLPGPDFVLAGPGHGPHDGGKR